MGIIIQLQRGGNYRSEEYSFFSKVTWEVSLSGSFDFLSEAINSFLLWIQNHMELDPDSSLPWIRSCREASTSLKFFMGNMGEMPTPVVIRTESIYILHHST